jgi:hypothetical protein
MDRERHRRRMVASMRNGRMWEAVKGRLGLSRRHRGERGAVLIEAIIVIPLMMMITLGIIEYGSAYQQDSAVAAATRAGGRVASALSKTDFGVVTNPKDSGTLTADAVSSALQSVGSGTPQQLWIYDVAKAGSGPPFAGGCTHCVGYGWSSSLKAFDTTKLLSGSSPWLATSQNACPGGTIPIDQIAVWVQMNHAAVTHMFGGNKALTGKTIMRFEPDVNSDCAATTS